jgi:hypothetical protein
MRTLLIYLVIRLECLPDEMLEDVFHDCEICSWKPFEQFTKLQHFDASVIDG